ncbi:MAG: hypothetical protein KatS3mg057_0571 [Herpetosiphonaceae bacterium]|nr:MAG: hypothetical protein KatS3mg057_0571 [Herpetosiphonaceae bacterium]
MLFVELTLILMVLAGVWLLIWGARRFNLGQRSLLVALAMTTVSWFAFIVVTIALLVSLYVESAV